MTTQPFPKSANILPLDSLQASLARAGGKGANLARLARAGFPVPGGFLVTTGAYQEFVFANQLESSIQSILANGRLDDPMGLEDASSQIRECFLFGVMPARLVDELRAAYTHLGSPPVAVRSSATAEDLPEMSFAGQQDTYLNVTGPENLLTAVVACWSSLWTARAIGYRARSGLGQSGWLLGVVVQEMVASDVSGVLFTANPLTGLRSETVIDAAFGLGEALVSGQVEPDHFVLDSLSGEIHSQTLGAKQIVTRSKPGGGVESIPAVGTLCNEQGGMTRLTLSEDEVKQLTAAGQQIQHEFGAPQDIEWALAGGNPVQ